jgi:hypothetical protein
MIKGEKWPARVPVPPVEIMAATCDKCKSKFSVIKYGKCDYLGEEIEKFNLSAILQVKFCPFCGETNE